MLNIILPIAGRGSRFSDAGYDKPKPLISVRGTPMIGVVIENIRPSRPHRFIFVAQQAHLETTNLAETLEHHAPGSKVVSIDGVTEGAACTVLLAREFIDTDDALMLANSDQYVDCDIDAYLQTMDDTAADGLIMTFFADSPKWSYVQRNDHGEVCAVVEKQVVSHEATVGIYNFRRGADFAAAADRMIAANLRVNGEFYVAPVYTELVALKRRIVTHDIGAAMFGLGTPEDLEAFLASPPSRVGLSH